MSLKLLVDECMLDKIMVQQLKDSGHDVQTVTEASLAGKSDDVIFSHAIAENRIVITYNCDDFVTLARERTAGNEHHPGVLSVYRYHNKDKDMSYADIIQAIKNVEASGVDLTNEAITLNHYNYPSAE